MKELKSAEEFLREKGVLADHCSQLIIVNSGNKEKCDIVELIKAVQKNAIEVAVSRAQEEFKVVEIEEVTDRANYASGTKLVHKIDHMSVFECKEKLLISLL